MNLNDFCTKTIIRKRKFAGVDDEWLVALDIGYSAVKGMSQNSHYCFPSFAKKADADSITIGSANNSDIQYMDENGVIWDVGDMAVGMLSQDDSGNSEEVLYSRNRYSNPMYLVIARVGIAMGMRTNEFGNPQGKKLILQTGLPPKYIKGDASALRKVLVGKHNFSVKIGDSPWIKFSFELTDDSIFIMGQPMGSFFSAVYKDDGVEIPDTVKYFNSTMLIFDGGFGTLDTFEIKRRRIDAMQTFDNLGMKAVFHRAAEMIYKEYDVTVSVPAFQNNLKSGCVHKFNRDTVKTVKIPIHDIVEKANTEVCMNAITQIRQLYNDLIDCRYLLVTGGTGQAWMKIMKNYFAGMEDLEIIGANQNTDMPQFFSNVRGYYMFRYNALKSGK